MYWPFKNDNMNIIRMIYRHMILRNQSDLLKLLMCFWFNYQKFKNFMAWEFYIYNNMIVKQLSLNSKKSQYKRRKYIRIPIFHSIDHLHHLIYNSFSDQWGVTDFVLQVPFICTYAVYTIWTHILIVQSRNKRGLTKKKTSVNYSFNNG